LAAVQKTERWNGKPAKPSFVRLILCVLCGLCVPLLWSSRADAHPAPFSYIDLRIQPTMIEGTFVAHMFDLGHDLGIDPADRLLDPAVAKRQEQAIIALLAPRFTVRVDGQLLTPQWSGVNVIPDRQSLALTVRYVLAASPATVTVSALMFPYDPAHQTFVNIYEGSALTQMILDYSRMTFEYYSGSRQGTLAVARTFLLAGIKHIAFGPDHLIFLLGLLLLGGTAGRQAAIVTAFTIAHTLALSLAAFNVVSVPTRLIEPAIALSIIYVGADNLLIRDGRDVRAWIAGAFGIIHGFGYASVLRELDLSRRALAWSLVSFNAGVEIGQLLVVAVVATALAALRSRSESAGRQLAFAGSVAVMAAGAFWFVQRVFFPGGIS
jgi:hydrogenase/urease accessory protein HupE